MFKKSRFLKMGKKTIVTLVGLIGYSMMIGCGGSEGELATGPSRNIREWNIPEDEIISGGVPRDGIPALNNPRMISVAEATYISDEALVVGIVVDGQPRAYSHSVLDWHEVVNEDSAGFFTLSYCPLTGTAVAFDNTSLGRFGVSGLLYRNNLIMFDRITDSHWPQLRFQCDQGPAKNTRLRVLPVIETCWGTWKTLFPNTVILSFNTGFNRPYDQPGSAYPGYDILDSPPLFQQKGLDDRLPPKRRVHGVLLGTRPDNFQSKVYLIRETQKKRLIHDSVAGEPILVVDVGEKHFVLSFFRTVDGRTLTFELTDASEAFPFTFKDNETGSTWNVLGEAVAGPLAGTKLRRPLSLNAYWFAWGAFYPGAEIYQD